MLSIQVRSVVNESINEPFLLMRSEHHVWGIITQHGAPRILTMEHISSIFAAKLTGAFLRSTALSRSSLKQHHLNETDSLPNMSHPLLFTLVCMVLWDQLFELNLPAPSCRSGSRAAKHLTLRLNGEWPLNEHIICVYICPIIYKSYLSHVRINPPNTTCANKNTEKKDMPLA